MTVFIFHFDCAARTHQKQPKKNSAENIVLSSDDGCEKVDGKRVAPSEGKANEEKRKKKGPIVCLPAALSSVGNVRLYLSRVLFSNRI